MTTHKIRLSVIGANLIDAISAASAPGQQVRVPVVGTAVRHGTQAQT